jgi:hypothetical protein
MACVAIRRGMLLRVTPPLVYIRPRVHLALHTTERHIPDQAEYWAFGSPRAVVLATNRPGNTRVAVGVAPINLVFVVEIDGIVECFFGRIGPFETLLQPFGFFL